MATEIPISLRNDSQEDLFDLRSNSSAGKPKSVCMGIDMYRNTQPGLGSRKKRVRKSRLPSRAQQLPNPARKAEVIDVETVGQCRISVTLESPDALAHEQDPPPAKIRSDIFSSGSKRPRPAHFASSPGPFVKRPRASQPIESIESEDELSKDGGPGGQGATSIILASPRQRSSRGDIQPTQFLKPQPARNKAYGDIPRINIKKAVSGKHFRSVNDERHEELFLQQASTGSGSLLPQSTSKDDSSLDWMRIDVNNVTSVQHAGSRSLYVLLSRPRGSNYGSQLWLELLDHKDVSSLVCAFPSDKTKELFDDDLGVRWTKALTEAVSYMGANRIKLSSRSNSPNTRQVHTEGRKETPPEADQDDRKAAPPQRPKLVDKMRNSFETAAEVAPPNHGGTREDTGSAKTPITRRTRRSSPVYVLREPTPDGWTRQNPGWRSRWHKSLVFPATGKSRATVDDDDIMRLDEGEFLNDNIISFYIRYLQFKLELEKPELLNKVYFFNTFFFEKLRSTKGKINYDGVKSWTAKIDLFSYDYIVVPVNEHAHWYLAIICNAPNAVNGVPGHDEVEDAVSPVRIAAIEREMSDVTIGDDESMHQQGDAENTATSPSTSKSLGHSSPASNEKPRTGPAMTPRPSTRSIDPRTPKIVTLDSLGKPHGPTCKALKDYLIAEASDKKGVTLAAPPSGMMAKKIPEQDNYCDCGVYVLGYMEEFLKDPAGTVRKLLQREPSGWDIRPPWLRNEVRELLFKLQQEQQSRLDKEAAEKRQASAKRGADKTPTKPETSPIPARDSVTGKPAPISQLADTGEKELLDKHGDKPNAQQRATTTPTTPPPKPSRTSKDGSGSSTSPCRDVSHSDHSAPTSQLPSEPFQPLDDDGALPRGANAKHDARSDDLVETLPSSPSEHEVEVTRSISRPMKKNLTVDKAADVEEVMAIPPQKVTRHGPQRLEQSSTMVQVLRSSQSPQPRKTQARYDGIERSVDLT
ncbi:hypothetical protein UVI_02040620 [Ustilaginoidea virens]|uniref:Ubiquitin-like protease family profile domain-containing protein n=1 Tax=Ustilaginoidea virens TaxID=1159556 RepID=A0A1B5L9S1_USTVR|nr:hypothetical protein UVI_02040620 [Ustilaginoidea virens]